MSEILAQIQLRRDTSSNWQTNNPILKQGEMGLIVDGIIDDETGKFYQVKIGDGTTRWNSISPIFLSFNKIIGISNISVSQSSMSGGVSTLTLTMSNGSTTSVSWYNGVDASRGSAFTFASSATDKSSWDTGRLYLVPGSVTGKYDMWYYDTATSQWIEEENAVTLDLSTSASDVTYTNTNSHLAGSNLQSALDETALKEGYFECSTAAATSAKAFNATGWAISTGGAFKVKFTYANTASSATLNINSTGAKTIFYNGEAVSDTNSWDAGETVVFYYDGTYYQGSNVVGGGRSIVYNKAQNLSSEQMDQARINIGLTYTEL